MDRRVKFFGLLVLTILLFLVALYSYYSPEKFFSSGLENLDRAKQQSNLINFNGGNFSEAPISLGLKDLALFPVVGEEVYFKVLRISSGVVKAQIKIPSTIFDLSLSVDEVKKIDVNGDGYYDFSVLLNSISESGAEFVFESINEKRPSTDLIGVSWTNAFKNLEDNARRQSSLIFVLSVILFIVLFLYLFNTFLKPYLRLEKVRDREEPVDAMKILLKEAESLKDKKKLAKLLVRIKHLFSYLEDSDKEEYQSRIKNIENYLNKRGAK